MGHAHEENRTNFIDVTVGKSPARKAMEAARAADKARYDEAATEARRSDLIRTGVPPHGSVVQAAMRTFPEESPRVEPVPIDGAFLASVTRDLSKEPPRVEPVPAKPIVFRPDEPLSPGPHSLQRGPRCSSIRSKGRLAP